uniref:Condensin complex subunit 1 C-terminal domain-containing protein n=3 Tax=Clastoptera arizonana TaxID=38151 RepID=A0A1B6E9H8_9HEMI
MFFGSQHKYMLHEICTRNISSKMFDRLADRAIERPIPSEHFPKHDKLADYEVEIFAPHVDVTRAKVAFGDRAIPKLRKELRNRNILVVKQALCSLLDMAHDPEKAVQIISLNVIPWLEKLMKSDDSFIRKTVLQILRVISDQPRGKCSICKTPAILENISLLLSDPETIVRKEAAYTLLVLASRHLVVKTLVEENFINIIVYHLEKEINEDIMTYLLETLELLLDLNEIAHINCLKINGCNLAAFLENPNPRIRAKTAAVLAQLFIHQLGKEQAVQHEADIMKMLTICLDDEDEIVKINASAALMFGLTTTPAKLHALNLKLLPRLLHYTQISNCPSLQRNCIKALTNLAEAPVNRAKLLKVVDFLQNTDCNGNKDIENHLETLVNTILWQP